MNQIHEISWDFDIDNRLQNAPFVIKVGDRIRFKYATGARHNVFFHDVVEVPRQNFLGCDMTGIASDLAGFGAIGVGGIDTIELSPVFQETGERYFVCSLPNHCEAGMKIAVKVVDVQKSSPKAKCDKCGLFDDSGILSCCAPGGTWFQNCGGNNEPHFDHTWVEGAQACDSKLVFCCCCCCEIACQDLCRSTLFISLA